MTEELKPCPFCNGRSDLLVIQDPYISSYISYNFYVQCDDCGVEGPSIDVAHNTDCRSAIKEAITAWNKRAPEACDNDMMDK